MRLRNWVGDTTLGVPLLRRLHDAGFDLQLVGKGWARDLLAGHGWPVQPLPKTFGERLALWKRLKAEAMAADAGLNRRINALCLPYSFSSALEFRLAGLRALGHAYEGRSLLLARAVPKPPGVHELQVYWELGNRLLGDVQPPPDHIGLRIAPQHELQARALRERHQLPVRVIVICPFAGGTWAKQDKTWPAFAAFARDVLPRFGLPVVVCPGPGEDDIARRDFASARLLPGVGLGAYAALLRDAALMVSNDTGPGHIAAAVGTPLVSVLGPSDPLLWRAWGPGVHVVQGNGTWPDADAVARVVARVLDATASVAPGGVPPASPAAGE